MNNNKNNVYTTKKTPIAYMGDICKRMINPPMLGVRLGGNKGEVYPSMTKGEIRNVGKCICNQVYSRAR